MTQRGPVSRGRSPLTESRKMLVIKRFPRFETWEIKNDNRDPKVTSKRIQVNILTVRSTDGRFAGGTVNF